MQTPTGEDPQAGAPRSILRDRTFRLFWVGESISLLGSTISTFTLPLVAVVVLQASPGQMGLILALGEAPPIVIGLLAGAYVDRVRRRRLLIGIDLAAAAIVASIPLMHALDLLTIQWMYGTSLLFGAVGALAWPAWNAFVPSLVSKERLVDANSKMMLSWSASGVIGPGIGGVLVELIRAPATLLVDALSFLVSALVLSRLRVAEKTTADQVDLQPLMKRIALGIRTAFLEPMQRAVTAPRAILDFVDAMSLAVYAIYVLRTVDLTPFLLGLIFACGATGFVAGSLVVGRVERRLGAGRAALLGLLLVGLSPFTMVLANDDHSDLLNILLLGFPGVLGGFGGVIQYVTLSSIRQAITPDAVLGRVYASVGVVGGLMSVAGAITGGFLGEAIGLRPTIFLVACLYTLPVVYAILSPLRKATTRDVDDQARAEAFP